MIELGQPNQRRAFEHTRSQAFICRTVGDPEPADHIERTVCTAQRDQCPSAQHSISTVSPWLRGASASHMRSAASK